MFPQKYLDMLIDKDVWAMNVIDEPHSRVHEGVTFIGGYKTPDASPLDDNASLVLLLVTGAKAAHASFDPHTGAEGEFIFNMEVTAAANGTPLSLYNMNRSENLYIPKSQLFLAPTISDTSRQLNFLIPGGSTQQSRAGGALRMGTEFELAPNKKYAFTVTNRGGNAQQASFHIQFYEE